MRETEFEQYVSELCNFLRLPSVSADSNFYEGVMSASDWVFDQLEKIGLQSVTRFDTDGYPVIYGEFLVDSSLPTVLFYGHYDVQPVDPLELWESAPFEPTIRDGQLVARGVSDDKGQIFCHFKAIERLLKSGTFPVNLKVMIEGEEEIGSPSLKCFVESHLELLQADVLVVSDTPMFGKDQPSVCLGLRGLTYFQIDVRTADTDLHSGQHGGAVPNAIQVLLEMLGKLKDSDGRILIPGVYDDVVPMPETLRSEIGLLPHDDETYAASMDIRGLVGEVGYSTLERRWYRPTLDVNGIWGGYMGQGSKTVIPCEAHAKVSLRLVADQDPLKIVDLFESYIREISPGCATVSVQHLSEGSTPYPVVVSPDHAAVRAALDALQAVYGVKPFLQGEGGSIPVVAMLQQLLGIQPVLLGLNLPEDKIHAPNEQFSLDNFRRGILVLEEFYLRMGRAEI